MPILLPLALGLDNPHSPERFTLGSEENQTFIDLSVIESSFHLAKVFTIVGKTITEVQYR